MEIFDFDPFSVEPVDFPGIFGMIGNLLEMIFTLGWDIIEGLHFMLKGLRNVTKIIDGIVIGIKNNNVQGIPVLHAIELYHYLVGDIVFYMTYLMILFGVTFTIIKLVLLIKKVISDYLTLGQGGLFNKLVSLLGIKS